MSEQKWSAEEVDEIKERILTALEMVIDPELGIDIVNLGLIYEIEFDPENGDTVVKMTLTTMGCPLADILTESIHDALKEVPEVSKAEVKLVWYPAWTTDKMSRYARIALGIRQVMVLQKVDRICNITNDEVNVELFNQLF